ncbi:MAG: hypothetical protein ACQCN6_08030 [Candidatus Bathyarchaeia archaeon]|jgi:hypothetical protein
MAYLRERKKELDIDFPLESVWQAIPKAVAEFDWQILEKNDAAHQITIETSDTLTSYGSALKVELNRIDQNATHMVISGVTPVTTITSTLQFGQTYDCIEDFVLGLADVMNR